MNNGLELQILRLYGGSDREGWDLHAFFELAGDARDRGRVLEIVDDLVAGGYLESRGSDFYTITERGREAAQQGFLNP
jgi:DNA-binding PadR family transcriptional regulator